MAQGLETGLSASGRLWAISLIVQFISSSQSFRNAKSRPHLLEVIRSTAVVAMELGHDLSTWEFMRKCLVSPIGKDHWLIRRLEQQPDLTYVGLGVVVRPVRHFVRRILAYDITDRSGIYGVWSVQSLWAPLFGMELEDTIGFSMKPLNLPVMIMVKDIPKPVSYEAFREGIETETLPYLRSVDSMERLYQEITRRPANVVTNTPESNFCLELAAGNFDAARKLLDQGRDRWFRKADDPFDEDELDQLRQLCRLLEDKDYGGIALLLHQWEASTAEYSDLDGIWEPSPFPFEPGYEDWLRRLGAAPI